MGFWVCPHCAAKEDLVLSKFPICNQALKSWEKEDTIIQTGEAPLVGASPQSPRVMPYRPLPSFMPEVPTIACWQCQGSLQEKDYYLTDSEVQSSKKKRLLIAGLFILLNWAAWGVLVKLRLSAWLYIPFFLISLSVAFFKKYKLKESLRPPEVYRQDPLAYRPRGLQQSPSEPLPKCTSDEG
jgi:hypothetical protein